MITLLSILIILASIVLVLIVLIQKSKGGGLSSNFSSSNQIMGAPRTADLLEKMTWYLAGTVIVLSLISNKIIGNNAAQQNQPVQQEVPVDNTQAPDMNSPQPSLPTAPRQVDPATTPAQ